MGRECVKIYDSFEWAEEIEADEGRGIVGVAAEDRYDLETVFRKFDSHFGVHNYRNIKRQEFLNTKRGSMSIMDYISELKRKAEHCQYGDHKEGFICDMIINGINDKKCSEKLMEIPADQLTLDRVIRTCRQVELTSAHVKSLGAESASVNVAQHSKPGFTGHRGGYKPREYQGNHPFCKKCCRHHEFRNCPAYNKICDNCGGRGHFKASKLCKSNPPHRGFSRGASRGSARGRGARHRGRGNKKVHYMDNEKVCDNDLGEMFEQCASVQDVFVANVDTLKTQVEQDWKVKFKVNNTDLLLEIDSGAMCNVLSRNTAERFRSVSQIKQSDTIINGISGKQMKAFGKITLPCEYKGAIENIVFQVIDTPRNVNLLGREDSVNLGLIARVNSVEVTTSAMINEFSDVIGEDIGCLPGEYEIKLDKSVTPVVHAPRTVPVAIRDQLKSELNHLERCRIIDQVKEPTEWVNSMVCVRKKNGRVRICIDPTDLNKAILREHYPMNSIDDVATRLHGSKYFTTLDASMGYFQIKLAEESSKLTTFNTPFGRYKYLRMPMGIKMCKRGVPARNADSFWMHGWCRSHS
jgi:hypothetical protein